ncbi:hypothetical protein ACRRTK_018448 [Alexandromys fortis]
MGRRHTDGDPKVASADRAAYPSRSSKGVLTRTEVARIHVRSGEVLACCLLARLGDSECNVPGQRGRIVPETRSPVQVQMPAPGHRRLAVRLPDPAALLRETGSARGPRFLGAHLAATGARPTLQRLGEARRVAGTAQRWGSRSLVASCTAGLFIIVCVHKPYKVRLSVKDFNVSSAEDGIRTEMRMPQ